MDHCAIRPPEGEADPAVGYGGGAFVDESRRDRDRPCCQAIGNGSNKPDPRCRQFEVSESPGHDVASLNNFGTDRKVASLETGCDGKLPPVGLQAFTGEREGLLFLVDHAVRRIGDEKSHRPIERVRVVVRNGRFDPDRLPRSIEGLVRCHRHTDIGVENGERQIRRSDCLTLLIVEVCRQRFKTVRVRIGIAPRDLLLHAGTSGHIPRPVAPCMPEMAPDREVPCR